MHMRLKESAARNFVNELYKEQIEYQTSLLLRCTKLYSDEVILLTEQAEHVDLIKSKAVQHRKEQTEIRDIDAIYKREFDEVTACPLEEQIEKLAILTHIFSREFQEIINVNQA